MISFICAIPQEPDDKAFMLSLYDSYYKLMYSIAYKYVSDILTVDDISLLHFYSFFVLWNKGVCKLFMCVISSFLLSVLESIV